ncbi:hypothetical protein TSAR_000513, partial [Trichomalopsis sarcophagae]
SDKLIANMEMWKGLELLEYDQYKIISRTWYERVCNRETLRLVLKKELLMRPYQAQYHQELEPQDAPQRLRFARWMTLRMLADENFPARILFTDESTFTNMGTINRQNTRYWAAENPCWKIDQPSTRNNIAILRRLFRQRLISLRTEHPWPSRSPDLTPLDFFVWPYVKERVYTAAPATRDEMCNEIIRVFATITPEMLANVRRSFVERIEKCIENDGGHIEHEM